MFAEEGTCGAILPIWAFVILAALAVQILKFVLYWALQRQKNFKILVSSNGFPSLHAVVFACLATLIWCARGGQDPAYNAVLIYGAIILHDAMRVKGRVEEGRTLAFAVAQRLQGRLARPFSFQELLLGSSYNHRPAHVLAGVVLGIVLGLAYHYLP
ncbi:MAG TPA: divergent PAP2 family protein [Candidatus Krumholzibacteria bacterium]|nr:divergent PAP2 family protein [Candidatus Krumholzibacteria bacterium]